MRLRDVLVAAIVILVSSMSLCSCTTRRPQAQAPPKEPPQPPKTYVFQCQDKSSFTVRFEDDKASIFLPVGTVVVPRVPAVSGAKYSEDKTSIWRQGETALVQLGGKAYGSCANNPNEVAWEHARLNGVDFRAAGSKPDWLLEITDNERIVFVADSGKKRHEFPYAAPTVDPSSSSTTYLVKNGKQQLRVVIVTQQCRDASSGKIFDAAVFATLDGKLYKGCGKALR